MYEFGSPVLLSIVKFDARTANTNANSNSDRTANANTDSRHDPPTPTPTDPPPIDVPFPTPIDLPLPTPVPAPNPDGSTDKDLCICARIHRPDLNKPNATDNIINSILLAGAGNDILHGDLGDDTLIGGSGNDVFVLGANLGLDVIVDFKKGEDAIELLGGLTFERLTIVRDNNNSLIKLKENNRAIASLTGVDASLINVSEFRLIS